jgi:hypothetical protein
MGNQFLKCLSLVDDPLVTKIEFEFGTTFRGCSGIPTGDSTDYDPGFFQEAYDLTVFDIEVLDLLTRFIINDLAVGKHPVNVKKNCLDDLRFLNLVFGVA